MKMTNRQTTKHIYDSVPIIAGPKKDYQKKAN